MDGERELTVERLNDWLSVTRAAGIVLVTSW
jgi:hypothetical protein